MLNIGNHYWQFKFTLNGKPVRLVIVDGLDRFTVCSHGSVWIVLRDLQAASKLTRSRLSGAKGIVDATSPDETHFVALNGKWIEVVTIRIAKLLLDIAVKEQWRCPIETVEQFDFFTKTAIGRIESFAGFPAAPRYARKTNT